MWQLSSNCRYLSYCGIAKRIQWPFRAMLIFDFSLKCKSYKGKFGTQSHKSYFFLSKKKQKKKLISKDSIQKKKKSSLHLKARLVLQTDVRIGLHYFVSHFKFCYTFYSIRCHIALCPFDDWMHSKGKLIQYRNAKRYWSTQLRTKKNQIGNWIECSQLSRIINIFVDKIIGQYRKQ